MQPSWITFFITILTKELSPSKTKLRCNNQHPDVLSITKINVQTVKTVETNIMANSERFVFKNLWFYKKYFVRFLFNNYILAGLYWSLIPPKVSFLGSVKKKKERKICLPVSDSQWTITYVRTFQTKNFSIIEHNHIQITMIDI